jgi:hypothetical protein
MKATAAKHKTIVHETREECKIEEHHFVGNKDLIKEIEKKAYEIYEGRGSVPGRELDDWLEAERLVGSQAPV